MWLHAMKTEPPPPPTHADVYASIDPLFTPSVQDRLYHLALRDIRLEFSISNTFMRSD